MDTATGSALQQLADERLGGPGATRARVEALRREGQGWRQIAPLVSAESRLTIRKSTLHRWADEGGWDVNPAAPAEQAS